MSESSPTNLNRLSCLTLLPGLIIFPSWVKNFPLLSMAIGWCSSTSIISSLLKFQGVKRRLEFKGLHSDVQIYDDFAHHPTAIEASSKAIRKKFPSNKILGVIELASNTMSKGVHGNSLIESSSFFDEVIWLDHKNAIKKNNDINISNDLADCIQKVKNIIKDYDIVVCMTNKDSQKITKPIIDYLNEK